MNILDFIATWCIAVLRISTPLLFVTLGETLTQRTGIIDRLRASK